jgi:hypothetical protein
VILNFVFSSGGAIYGRCLIRYIRRSTESHSNKIDVWFKEGSDESIQKFINLVQSYVVQWNHQSSNFQFLTMGGLKIRVRLSTSPKPIFSHDMLIMTAPDVFGTFDAST